VADVVDPVDAAASHSFSAWSTLRGVSHPKMMGMTSLARSPALLLHKLHLFPCSSVEALKLMMNQSLTTRMRMLLLTLLLTLLYPTVPASMT